ncbi:UNVERIFIED_CONTAM: Retrovirus-related Pol polyprotein from type-2 retrotransposable element R2DM [Sesamum radiatum]|uniref:Retrovirus-related Pol polyprotein from type-2 retrotransposable element R2DM n=1 Tax=Sesamum radiatum TaxID=300843 RepID=A0AAW2J7G4_SESRA
MGTANNKDPIPFRFYNFLAEQPGFLDSVKRIWRLQIHGTRMLVYCAAIKIETSMLQQRAKLHWLKYGDQCSKVFFRKINARRVQQRVFQITTQSGQRLTDMPQVTAEFVSFFQTLLGGNRRRSELNLSFLQQGLKHVLTREEGEGLIAPVSMAEIKEAFFDISSDSARGPDGYTSMFFMSAWPEIGRSISDNILMAQELLAGYNNSKLPPCCNIKIDIQKAYDSVEWDFLLEGLRVFNFPPRFVGLVEQCVSTATFSVSLNGAVYGFFQSARGLRQGDPMSPYLFVLVMELWRTLLSLRVQAADQFQYHWKCKELGLLNLCFADDILLFCRGNVQSVHVFRDALAEFATMSGLRVSPTKSQLILSRSSQAERQQILDMMGFQEGNLPITYLGVPLVSSRLSVAVCYPLIQKVDRKLAGWNHLNLSFAGRVQLIKSVLSSLHTYWASVFILPKAVLKIIEERMRSFLWKGASGSGAAKVSWYEICRSKKEGGLGIRRVVHINQALMLKHIWRVLQEDKQSIWVAWVLGYRLHNQTLWTVKVSNATWCWKKLVNLSALIKPGLPFDSFLHEVLRNGHWMWPLETDFSVNEIVSCLPNNYPGESDAILWKFNSGRFSTAAALALLQPPSPFVSWNGLLEGHFKIPQHVFILWLAIKERLSTMDRPWLGHKGADYVLCNNSSAESHSHLFFTCAYSKRRLSVLEYTVRFKWPGFDWQMAFYGLVDVGRVPIC